MIIRAHGLTDQGKVRPNNEDTFLAAPELGLYVVCDGLGGHACGEVASMRAAASIRDHVQRHRPATPGAVSDVDLLALLHSAFEAANENVYNAARKKQLLTGMATTATALLLHGRRAAFGHVGDSRLYLVRGTDVAQITRDHTVAQRMVDDGRLLSDEKEQSPFANVLTRTIGGSATVVPELHVIDLRDGDVFVLCSDGASRYLRCESEVGRLVASRHPKSAARAIVDMAKERGGEDNITALVVSVRGRPVDGVRAIADGSRTRPRPGRRTPPLAVAISDD